MNKRIWGVIAVIIGLLIIIGIIFFLLFYKPLTPGPAVPVARKTPTADLPKPEEQTEQPATVQPVKPLAKAEVKRGDLARLAAAFAERFGSFSNQSDYGNIRDLQIFMTVKMQDWSQSYISQEQAKKTDTSIYHGIVTKSIISEVRQFDETAGQAEILVKTQRRESTGVTSNSTTFFQDIIIKSLREKGVWRVDEAVWQAR